ARARLIESDLDRAERGLRARELSQARDALSSAEARMVAGAPDGLRQRLRRLTADLDMAVRLEGLPAELLADELESRTTHAARGKVVVLSVKAKHLERYRAAFAAYGLDVRALGTAAAARRLAASPIREQLLDALFHWAFDAVLVAPDDSRRLEALLEQAEEN